MSRLLGHRSWVVVAISALPLIAVSGLSASASAAASRSHARPVSARPGRHGTHRRNATHRRHARPGLVSPQVVHTGTAPTGYTVTFRFFDPSATTVQIRGEWFFSNPAATSTTSSQG